jgi:hydroxymethylpyrimidine/phosphomethylpyrimidine kinase
MQTSRASLPIALTIAGSDSGGGAGIQADLKVFQAMGVHGTSAITCLTAQNPRGVTGIQAASPVMVRQQIEAVFTELPPRAIKTGMLYSAGIIRAVAKSLHSQPDIPLVIDPVMVATSGARLLKPGAIRALTHDLFPRAALVTPNLDEAALLLNVPLRSVEDLRAAAKQLHLRFGCAVLVKGGHLRGLREAADIYWDGRQELLLTAPFVLGVGTHGTGCTYSAAITAGMARGRSLAQAVFQAKEYVTQAIAGSRRVAGHCTLDTRTIWR